MKNPARSPEGSQERCFVAAWMVPSSCIALSLPVEYRSSGKASGKSVFGNGTAAREAGSAISPGWGRALMLLGRDLAM